MACKAMGISALVLRILTILLSATCIAVFLTDTFKNEDGSKSTFKSGAGIPQAEEARSAIEKFFDKAYIANGLLLGAFACTAVVSVVSSINRPQSTSSGIFG
ncbi:uncharacterized protein LOC102626289 [Citrus sinensis]|uniref:uncharacterized protein LOC102626289 n=1 Tax=Citrus sinensis TaxID=2711 RepID=UPI002278C89A|nr:uncharacterized protein LOC102626289 [Citrus sinensis]